MLNLDKLKNSPTAISLGGWILFYAGLLSVVGLGLLTAITNDLALQGELAEQFGTRMAALFGAACVMSLVVFGWAMRRWSQLFINSVRLYGQFDVVMVAVIGLTLGSVIWFSAYPKG